MHDSQVNHAKGESWTGKAWAPQQIPNHCMSETIARASRDRKKYHRYLLRRLRMPSSRKEMCAESSRGTMLSLLIVTSNNAVLRLQQSLLVGTMGLSTRTNVRRSDRPTQWLGQRGSLAAPKWPSETVESRTVVGYTILVTF